MQCYEGKKTCNWRSMARLSNFMLPDSNKSFRIVTCLEAWNGKLAIHWNNPPPCVRRLERNNAWGHAKEEIIKTNLQTSRKAKLLSAQIQDCNKQTPRLSRDWRICLQSHRKSAAGGRKKASLKMKCKSWNQPFLLQTMKLRLWKTKSMFTIKMFRPILTYNSNI